jgi:Amt family ammonium transporter
MRGAFNLFLLASIAVLGNGQTATNLAEVNAQIASLIAEVESLTKKSAAQKQTIDTLLNGTNTSSLVANLDAQKVALDDFKSEVETMNTAHNESYDTCWLLYSTSLVMLMQLGFALVEAGSVRKKSYRHVFLKNLLDFTVGLTLWTLIGYWIAFPDTFDGDVVDFKRFDLFFNAAEARFFVFQSVFSSTAITIVSGAMAERTRMEAYLAFCALMGGMCYSVVVRWTWGGGWLSQMDVPYHDFAGSGIVHACGGCAALVGAWLVGPRAGRWTDASELKDDDKYKPHSVDNIIMGCLILWFGWFGFNPGSTCSLVEESADVAALAYVNTMVCPCFSAITAMIIGVVRHARHRGDKASEPPQFDLGKICNAVLGGLVGITAGCDSIPTEWTMVVGIVAGCGVEYWSWQMLRFKIDDPVDASAVHGFCGVIGVLAIGLLHKESGLLLHGTPDLFLAQLKGITSILGYVVGTSFVYFYVVHAFGFLRLNMVIEIVGVDHWEFHDGSDMDISELEMQALAKYKQELLDRLEGDVWGLNEETAINYAKMHRKTTVFWLCIAMFYNYFFYTVLEWRGWTFFRW